MNDFLNALLKMFFSWLGNSVSVTDSKTASTVTPVVDTLATKTLVTLSKIPVYGEISENVKAIQLLLNTKGAKLDPDKKFGEATLKAIQVFQKSKGLAGSGVIGEKTLALLGFKVAAVVTPVSSSTDYPPSHIITGSRQLPKELEKIVDDYLVQHYNQELKTAIDKKDGNKIVSLFCRTMSELKVTEKTGNNDGIMVSYLQDTIGSPQKQSWCEDEYQSGVNYSEKKIGVKSRLPATESTIYVRDNCPKDMLVKVEDSQEGYAWVWQHGTTYTGHTGAFQSWLTPGKVGILNEGNTTHGVDPNGAIISNGGGAFQTHRSVGQIGDMHLIAVVRPFDKVT